jgi:hypothetical protein
MAILPKAIYMFIVTPIKIPVVFITEIRKSILMFIWKHKRLQIAKAILSKENNAGGITMSNYRAIAIKKKYGTSTKTDMKTSGTEYKTQI